MPDLMLTSTTRSSVPRCWNMSTAITMRSAFGVKGHGASARSRISIGPAMSVFLTVATRWPLGTRDVIDIEAIVKIARPIVPDRRIGSYLRNLRWSRNNPSELLGFLGIQTFSSAWRMVSVLRNQKAASRRDELLKPVIGVIATIGRLPPAHCACQPSGPGGRSPADRKG